MFQFANSFVSRIWGSKARKKYYQEQPKAYPEAIKVFEVDQHLKKRLAKREYKKTANWKGKKHLRFILGYLPIIFPFFCTVILSLYRISSTKDITDIEFNVLAGFGACAVITWPVGIVNLKTEIHNAKIIPENRYGDRLIFDENQLTYTFFDSSTRYSEIRIMRYCDITKIQYSDCRHMLYIFGGYYAKTLKDKQMIKAQQFQKSSGLYVDIPMYFTEEHDIRELLTVKTGAEIEVIENSSKD